MTNTFRFQLVLKLRLLATVEVLKNLFPNFHVSSTERFMASSLDKLLSYFYGQRTSIFWITTFFNLQLLHQKRFYPYFCFNSYGNFQDKSMPSVRKRTNSLPDGQLSIAPESFLHATNFLQMLESENVGSYHDLYITTHTLLLACVVEQFRKGTISTYGLVSAHYYTCSRVLFVLAMLS